MFYIRARSIKGHETSRGYAYTADLLQTGTDARAGIVENYGNGGMTSFNAVDIQNHKLVNALAEKHGVRVDQLMETYMDIAEGNTDDPLYPELFAKLTSN
jgi:hypothetical protein